MRRREFVGLIGGAACFPIAGRAQPLERLRRIGILLLVSERDPEYQRRVAGLKEALRELGWTEKNILFEQRYAEGRLDRLSALAAELVNAKVDIVLTQGTDSTEAARKATTSIPIVMASIGDAVGTVIVTSLARPGGNITGLSLFATEQATKRLELIKEIAPGLSRLAVLWNGNNGSHRLQLAADGSGDFRTGVSSSISSGAGCARTCCGAPGRRASEPAGNRYDG